MKTLEYFANYILYLSSVFVEKATTKGLFKASVVLGTAFIVGAANHGASLYEQEVDAYEAKYRYEEAAGVPNAAAVDCDAQDEYISDCKITQHKLRSIDSFTNLFITVMDLIRMLFYFTTIGFILSFLFRPVLHGHELNKSIQPNAGVSTD